MTQLEFEQKYILDPRRHEDIQQALIQAACDMLPVGAWATTMAEHIPPTLKIMTIQQFYQNGDRYRLVENGSGPVCTRENKRNLKLDTPYAVSLEEEPEPVPLNKFNDKWSLSSRRLHKIRYQILGHLVNQQIMVDFFMPPTTHKVTAKPYAVVAEVEVMFNGNTKVLDLDLELPIYLKDFLLKTVDSRDASGKVFKSANMTEENISQIEQALEELYDQSV